MGQKLYEGDVNVDVESAIDAANQSATGIQWDGGIGGAVGKWKKKDFGQRAEAAKRLLKATGITKDAEASVEDAPSEEEGE